MAARVDTDKGAHTAVSVRWWPATIAMVALAVAYAFVADQLRLGPPWWLLALALATAVGARVLRWRGRAKATRWIAIGTLVAITVAITASAFSLVDGLLHHTADAGDLLRGGALVWVSNVLTFALWYWEVDAGGPSKRHARHAGSTDFAFPQRVLAEREPLAWTPDFVDYLFLAFNTSTAFSPTDTMVLARRAKVLMMYQSVVSLVTVAVLVARAINAL
ncbi:MAG TPA: DUF1345 domain-containing protein [Chloroflexota bacterium]